jgi:hypothetical protein
MALFNKKKDVKNISQFPKLPELPQLPELPEMSEESPDNSLPSINQLPKFPTDSLGKKFSQDTIKEAVTGKKREVFADEFAEEDEMRTMQGPRIRGSTFPLRETMSREITSPSAAQKIPPRFSGMRSEMRRKAEPEEPIYVRIDKFEEGIKALETAKKQIMEIEKLLSDIRNIKEDEEKELASWGKNIQLAKEQIEKIDREIFSKIE